MTLADIFVAPNFLKIDEYYEIEIYFDTETNYFYRLDGGDDGWAVTEYRPLHEEYTDLMSEYREIIKQGGLH